MDDYEEIALDTPLADLGAKFTVEFGERVALVDSRRTRNDLRRHLRLHLDGRSPTRMLDVPARRPVGEATAALAGLRPTRVRALPAGRIVGSGDGVRQRAWLLLCIPGVVSGLAGANVDGLSWERFLLLLVGVTLVVLGWLLAGQRRGARQWSFVHGGTTRTLDQLRLPAAMEAVIVPDVDAVKEEYGRLVSDIVYRIENPALFDPHQPLTQEFTLALLRWDDTQALLEEQERQELATRVVAGFRAARANAERIGIEHLPAESRTQAATALKAARLAADDGAAPAERAVALERAIRILDALALYYLPTGPEARDAIEGRPIRQLPGRRASS